LTQARYFNLCLLAACLTITSGMSAGMGICSSNPASEMSSKGTLLGAPVSNLPPTDICVKDVVLAEVKGVTEELKAGVGDQQKTPETVEMTKLVELARDTHTRFDFGPGFFTMCSSCGAFTKNRGDENTRKIYCVTCYQRESNLLHQKREELESYTTAMIDKLSLSGELRPFISEVRRVSFDDSLQATLKFLADVQEAPWVMYSNRLKALRSVGDPVEWRLKERGIRDEWIAAFRGTISNCFAVAQDLTAHQSHSLVNKCEEMQHWLDTKVAAQASLPKDIRPVLLCAEIEANNQELAAYCDTIIFNLC